MLDFKGTVPSQRQDLEIAFHHERKRSRVPVRAGCGQDHTAYPSWYLATRGTHSFGTLHQSPGKGQRFDGAPGLLLVRRSRPDRSAPPVGLLCPIAEPPPARRTKDHISTAGGNEGGDWGPRLKHHESQS